MKSLTLITLLVFVTACGNGNPHISSVRDGIDQIESPENQEDCEEQLSVVRVTTDENIYQDLTNCRGDGDPEEEQQQQQQQQQEDDKDSYKWKLLTPASQFGTKIFEVNSTAAISVRDCKGRVIIERTLGAGSRFFGITTPTYEICEVNLAY